MDRYKAYFAHNYSFNMNNVCIPKNALFGKTQDYFWYFTDYPHIWDSGFIINVASAGEKFRPYFVRRDNLIAQKLILPAVTENNLNANTVCTNVLCLSRISKPSLATAKQPLGRGRRAKYAVRGKSFMFHY